MRLFIIGATLAEPLSFDGSGYYLCSQDYFAISCEQRENHKNWNHLLNLRGEGVAVESHRLQVLPDIKFWNQQTTRSAWADIFAFLVQS